MSDLSFSTDEFLEAVEELVPSYQKRKISEAINDSSLEESDYDQLGLSLTGEKCNSGLIVPTSGHNGSTESLWRAIKGEVYDYLCTTSRRYSKERREAGITVKNLITILATAVASTFNIAIGVVAGGMTIALLSVLKIGKNAWCKLNEPAK